MYVALLNRMCWYYIEADAAQDARVFDTDAEPSANTESDLEPIASDWRKLVTFADNIFAPLTKISRINSP